jgi:Glycosyltransferase like family 2/PilZ domain
LWLGLPLIVAETWALLALTSFVFEAWRRTARSARPYRPGRRTAVVIPTYNEPLEVLRPTVLGALTVRADPPPEVWVLDDGGRDWVASMCDELRVRYLARPAPRKHAKAGNLNHALGKITAELLLIVDADHVPLPHALEQTIGYFEDPQVAFVQSPQVFFNRGFQHPQSSDDPLLNEQSLFYDVICPGKDRNNAAFWCGSSAVLRREALLSIGGVATDTVVEDAHTAMLMHAKGWRSAYHPEVLAVGLAPHDVNAFLVQRGRWARGCYQLLRKCNPLRLPGLSVRQRVHYLASLLHYLEGPQRLIALLVPPLALLTGTMPLVAPVPLYLTLFLPQLILVPLASHAMARGRYRYAEGERWGIVRAITYSRAAKALLTNKPIEFAVTPKGSEGADARPTILKAPILYAVIALGSVVYQTAAQVLHLPGELPSFAFAVTAAWALASSYFTTSTAMVAARIRHRRLSHRFPVSLQCHYTTTPNTLPLIPAAITDLNSFGLALTCPDQLPANQPIKINLTLGSHQLHLTGTIVRTSPDTATYGIAFDPLPSTTHDTIVRWCYQHPFGSTLSLTPPPHHEVAAQTRAA